MDIFNRRKLKKLEESNDEKTKLIIKLSREKVWYENIIGELLNGKTHEIECDGSRNYYIDYVRVGENIRVYRALKLGGDNK